MCVKLKEFGYLYIFYLKIVDFEDKGRGIVTTKAFKKGDFVIEYIGEQIDAATAKQRELQYSKNKNIGCYMYYFKHKNIQYWLVLHLH